MKNDAGRPYYPIRRAEIDSPLNQDIYAVIDPVKRIIYTNRAARPGAKVVQMLTCDVE